MIGILIPLLLLIPTPIKADEVVNPIYGPREEFDNPIVDWDPSQMGEWVQKMRDWESRKSRTSVEDSINNALANLEWNYGSDDPTEQEELLQFPSNGNKQGT